MGKAMAAQTARTSNLCLGGVFGGARAYGGKAKLHTTRKHYATVDSDTVSRRIDGMKHPYISNHVKLIRERTDYPTLKASSDRSTSFDSRTKAFGTQSYKV